MKQIKWRKNKESESTETIPGKVYCPPTLTWSFSQTTLCRLVVLLCPLPDLPPLQNHNRSVVRQMLQENKRSCHLTDVSRRSWEWQCERKRQKMHHTVGWPRPRPASCGAIPALLWREQISGTVMQLQIASHRTAQPEETRAGFLFSVPVLPCRCSPHSC